MALLELKHLLGWWHLERRMERFDGVPLGTMVGVARFGPTVEQRLLYRERVLHMPVAAPALAATQSYLYALFDNRLRLHFADARLFVDLLVVGDRTEWGEHACGRDHYRLRFSLLEGRRMKQEVEVVGPRKQYRTHTSWIKK